METFEPIRIKYRIGFHGGDADRHEVEAYPAAQSLEGLIWALSIVTNFGVSGKVRQKGDLSSSVRIFISPPRRGSVLNELNIFVQQNPFISLVVGGWAINTVTPYINSLIGYTFKATLTGEKSLPNKAKRAFGKLNDKDLDRVIERIEPPLTRAHAAIGKSVETISLGSPRVVFSELDSATKHYLEARAKNQFQIIETNITSYNVLTGNGRLYDPVLAQTVPFTIVQGVRLGTTNALTDSMRQYSLGRQGTIRITAQRVETLDGKLKQLRISSAEEIPPNDWIDNEDPLRSKRTID